MTDRTDDHESTALPTLEVRRLSPELRSPLAQLFTEASSGCFCRFWDFEGEDNDWLMQCALGDNARAFTSGDLPTGLVALAGADDGERRAVGWLKLSPAAGMHKLLARRVYRTLDCFEGERDSTQVVGCVLVHPEARGRGVLRALLRAAIEVAREDGAKMLEAFPRVASHRLQNHELQMGPHALFAELGFEPIDGPPPYPVMRLHLDVAG